MFKVIGKYTNARVNIEYIDDTTYKQIIGFVNHPAFKDGKISIMPDCHAGAGAVIGFTMPLNDYVIPNVIGVDIGCGMLSVKIDGEVNPHLLDNIVKSKIPSGFNIHETVQSPPDDLTEKINDTLSRVPADPERTWKSIGTLGGGNHFIEAGKDENGDTWITIHSGSRKFGLDIAVHYQKIAEEQAIFTGDKDLAALEINSLEGQNYLRDMRVAQEYASYNRMVMMGRILNGITAMEYDAIECVHNFIGDDNIIRKGATSAREQERIVIPFNMRDGLIIALGKGNVKWNNSAPHGAGRILSRSKAKKTISLDEYKDSMKYVYSSCVSASTLDEAPQAYKDKDIILDNIEPTAEVLSYVKPFYNFKAS